MENPEPAGWQAGGQKLQPDDRSLYFQFIQITSFECSLNKWIKSNKLIEHTPNYNDANVHLDKKAQLKL